MAKAASRDAALRRAGQTVYSDIVEPRKRAPIPAIFERRRNPNMRAFADLEFAREALSKRTVHATISARSRPKTLQHIVATRSEENGAGPPWQYRVVARCKAKLRRAAVKAGRQFLELDVCPKCWKGLA